MMKINSENYESYFLDYIEGNLNADDISEVEAFLLHHPELKADLEGSDMIRLPAEKIRFSGKASLIKTEHEYFGVSADDFKVIAMMEGDLKPEERLVLELELEQNSNLRKSHERFLLTRLIPDEAIQYPDKRSLKKKVRIIPGWIYTLAAAAAIAGIGWLIWPLVNQQDADPLQSGRQHAKPVEEIEQKAEPQNGNQVSYQDLTEKEQSVSKIGRQIVAMNEIAISEESKHVSLIPAELSRQVMEIAPMVSRPAPQLQMGIPIPMNLSVSNQTVSVARLDDYQTLPELLLKMFRIRILKEDPVLVKKTRFSMWEVADAGIDRINAFADTQMDFNREYNKDGEIDKISFNSRLLDISAPLRKP